MRRWLPGRKATLWFVVGFGLLQCAWLAALPPFRGADEVDHVYRAVAVSHGDWRSLPSAATLGTGAVVSIDSATVKAARPACEDLDYKATADCGYVGSGAAQEVPTAAGRYGPTYYVLIGYPARIFDPGVDAALAMRLASSGLCLGLLAAVLASLSRWGGRRRVVAVVVCTTPSVVYASVLIAPNGLEMVAALGWWVALAGLANDRDYRRECGHVTLATVCGALLVVLRPMGPLWALLSLILALMAWPDLLHRLRRLVRGPRGLVPVAVGLVAGCSSLAWVLTQRSLMVSQEPSGGTFTWGFRILRSLQELPVWILQCIGAFPFRNQPAPLFVYPCYLVVLVVLFVMGARTASSRMRWTLLLTVATGFALPLAITVATLDLFGTAWQGRYALPLLLGAALLAGDGWARSGSPGPSRILMGLGFVMLVAVHAAGIVAVRVRVTAEGGWTTGEGVVAHPPVWVVAALALAGALALAAPLLAVPSIEPALQGRADDPIAPSRVSG